MTLRRFAGQLEERGRGAADLGAATGPKSYRPDRYFVMLSAVAVAFILTAYFAHFAFLSTIRDQFESRQRIGAFMGIFFGAAKVLEFLSRLFFSTWLLRQFGLISGLLVLPLAVLACCLPAAAVGTAAAVFFPLIAMARGLIDVLRKSVFEPSFRVLYQPLPAAERFGVQTRVDGVVRQLAVVPAGGLLVLIGSVEAVGLLHVVGLLVMVAVAWIAVGRPLHREYRGKLVTMLESLPKTAATVSPEELIRSRLRHASPAEVRYSLNVLYHIAPGLLEELTEELLEARDGAVRQEALRAAKDFRLLAAWPAVARRVQTEADPWIREQAQGVEAVLGELHELHLSAEHLADLTTSADPRERQVAAMSLANAGSQMETLFGLLWDQDREVVRSALMAAGQLKRPELWPRLIDLVASAELCKAASSALITVGEPVLESLDLGFRHFAENRPAMLRVLRIYERIGGAAAERLLFDKIGDPALQVRQQALISLGTLGFRASEDQLPAIHRQLEMVVDSLTWYAAARLDVGGDAAVAELAAALDREIERRQDFIFLLLSLIRDPRHVGLMQQHLASGTAEERAYALEIAEQLVPEEMRPILQPILEQPHPDQWLDRLRRQFPQKSLGWADRLREILSRGGNRIDCWTRACAVDALLRLWQGPLPRELAANLYSSDPMVRELVAWGMHRVDPGGLAGRLARLPEPQAQELSGAAVLDAERGAERYLIFDKEMILKGTPVFSQVPRNILAGFAAKTDDRKLESGEVLFREGDPGRDLFVIVEGRIRIDKGGRTLVLLGKRELVGEIAAIEGIDRSASAIADEPARLLRIDRETIYDLLAGHMEVMPGIIESIAERQVRDDALR